MTTPALRTALDAIGIDWYVRSDQDLVDISDVDSSEVVEQFSHEVAAEPVETAAGSSSAQSVTNKETVSASVANLLGDIRLDEKPQPKIEKIIEKPQKSKPIEASSVQAPERFNWLVAECGRLLFVADIKQQRLSAVWHSAAIEMMTDIAIAMDQKQDVSSRYFNWPILTPNGQPLADVDLDGFLSAFLEHRVEKPLVLLMGDIALSLGKSFVTDSTQLVESPTLGELFTNPESKKLLWQKLKPLR